MLNSFRQVNEEISMKISLLFLKILPRMIRPTMMLSNVRFSSTAGDSSPVSH